MFSTGDSRGPLFLLWSLAFCYRFDTVPFASRRQLPAGKRNGPKGFLFRAILEGVKPRDRHRLKAGIGLVRGLHSNYYSLSTALSNQKVNIGDNPSKESDLLDQAFIQEFRSAVSNERIDMYRQRGVAGGDSNLLIHYGWNIVLAESFYPSLQCLEVVLRNAVHDAAQTAFETPLWFDIPGLLDERGSGEISSARTTLARKNKHASPPAIIAELNFGFWAALFASRMEQIFWPKIYRKAFPRLPRHLRKRSVISDRIGDIRKFRNRIFHHEPIWHLRDLGEKHAKIIETIGWINPSMEAFVAAIDRFPDLYRSGMSDVQAHLMSQLQTPELLPSCP
ncbi:MAG: hypothetical protein RBT16_14085 [Desulfococcus multivorans]|jgi:hypothetical protein|nr:hypothetical protein [Desulfococcus multivorans]